MLTLGIETSCDETSVAVLRDGREILSNVVSSQVDVHARFGGVVPEIASRAHLRQVRGVLSLALSRAGVELGDVHAIAVTRGPGLLGALLVGVSVAKGLSFATGRPVKGVHHLEGHLAAVGLSHGGDVPRPALGLVVSGGHTHLYLMPAPRRYVLVGQTRDDAAGEAFDKVGKALGLPYPAGPAIDRIAATGTPGRVTLPRTRVSGAPLDMSFSGLKAAAIRAAAAMGGPTASDDATRDILAEFRAAVVDVLLARVDLAAREHRPRSILVTGGVAANALLRARSEGLAERLGIPILFPSLPLTSDNAAMIAAAGHDRLRHEPGDGLAMDATATWSLDPDAPPAHRFGN